MDIGVVTAKKSLSVKNMANTQTILVLVFVLFKMTSFCVLLSVLSSMWKS